MREGVVTYIRVHLLRILWREGRKERGFTHIRVHLLRIL